jgi:Do/DeqQ family serine protease
MKNYIGIFSSAFFGGVISLSVVYLLPDRDLKHNYIEQSEISENVKPTLFNADNPVSSYVDLSLAAEEAVLEVVHIKVTQEGQEVVQHDPFEYFFKGNTQGRRYKTPDKQGSGSGVIIRKDGYIVTNNHVIDGADHIEVVLNNNKSYTAVVVGTDPSTDLALVKVNAENLKAIPMGNSDELKLGEWVLAVGNPYNLNSTVTAGIISAKARSINILQNTNGTPPLEAFIQTDAAVNPGNSGGALVNVKGELVGINSAIKSPTGSYSGYSFAVPVNIMKKVVNDIMEYGSVQRAFIGVAIQNISTDLMEKEDLETMSGVFVGGVAENGAANDAGIESGDVITAVNGVRVKSVAELQSQIGLYNPGDKVDVDVNRAGNEKVFTMELRNQKGNTEIVKAEDKAITSLAASFSDLEKELKNKLGIDNGVAVSNIRTGKIMKSGIKNGFIITHIDNEKVKDLEHFNEMIKSKRGGVLIGGIYPNGIKKYYGLGL